MKRMNVQFFKQGELKVCFVF